MVRMERLMMLKIGSNFVVRRALRVVRRTQYALRNTHYGFTLVEVMVATAILSLAVVLLYQTFFRFLDLFEYYSYYLYSAPWMNEKIWQAQDAINRLGPVAIIDTSGELMVMNKRCSWSLAYAPIDDAASLYRIDLELRLPEGKRPLRLMRGAYALYHKR